MMKLLGGVVALALVLGGIWYAPGVKKQEQGAPPYDTAFDNPPVLDEFAWLDSWKRPEGPPKVALQAGHWKNEELPDELERLRGSTGSSGGGKTEAEVNLAIAEEAKKVLEQQGIMVDILPATVPVGYWADVFVAIHADGSEDTTKSGFKAAAPRRSRNPDSAILLKYIEEEYGKSTKLAKDPNVTRNMRGYYAFAWWRHEHAVHPMTASVIVETGFLTSSADRRLIVNKPELSAQGLAQGIIRYLESEVLLSSPSASISSTAL